MGSWVRRSSCALLLAAACGGGAAAPPPGVSVENASAAPDFAFDSLDARPVSSAAFRGKPTVLGFVTTYDPVSQAEVNYLVEMAAKEPEVNFALVMLQDAQQRELVEMYRDAMHVKFPIALGDAGTIAGGGPLGDVHLVPTIVVLGADGKILWTKAGGARPSEIRAHLR